MLITTNQLSLMCIPRGDVASVMINGLNRILAYLDCTTKTEAVFIALAACALRVLLRLFFWVASDSPFPWIILKKCEMVGFSIEPTIDLLLYYQVCRSILY